MYINCLIHKRPGGKKPGLFQLLSSGKLSFQIIQIDYLGSSEKNVTKNKYILVVVDNLTKYV